MNLRIYTCEIGLGVAERPESVGLGHRPVGPQILRAI